MPISVYDEFVGIDWERYSKIGGKVAVATCIAFGSIDIVLRLSYLAALWTIVTGLAIAVWELPILFSLVPSFDRFHSYCMESLKLSFSEGRAVVCIVMGMFCFTSAGFSVLAGLVTLVVGLLHIFAAVNRRADEAAGLRSDASPSEYPTSNRYQTDSHHSLLSASNKFGTF